MSFKSSSHSRYVVGPDGAPLTIADLPDCNTMRWVTRRKAQVVAAVQGGLLSLEEACERYRLTVDEFLNWKRSIETRGLDGLRATKFQQYRMKTDEPDQSERAHHQSPAPEAAR